MSGVLLAKTANTVIDKLKSEQFQTMNKRPPHCRGLCLP